MSCCPCPPTQARPSPASEPRLLLLHPFCCSPTTISRRSLSPTTIPVGPWSCTPHCTAPGAQPLLCFSPNTRCATCLTSPCRYQPVICSLKGLHPLLGSHWAQRESVGHSELGRGRGPSGREAGGERASPDRNRSVCRTPSWGTPHRAPRTCQPTATQDRVSVVKMGWGPGPPPLPGSKQTSPGLCGGTRTGVPSMGNGASLQP